MPCEYYTPGEQRSFHSEELNRVTRAFCDLATAVESSPHKAHALLLGAGHVGDLWREHQSMDRERERDERERQARAKRRERALAKLTPEELEALGVSDGS